MSALVQRYTASVFFDRRMAQVDITGSLAHAKMLAAQGIISAQDLADIERGMAQIRAEIEAGSFDWKLELEDVHLNIENSGAKSTPGAAATTRWRATSASGCAGKLMRLPRCSLNCSRRSWTWRRNTLKPSCPA